MPQVFQPRANPLVAVVLVSLALILLAIAGLMMAFGSSPYATGAGRVPAQPVPFSHEHHAGGLGVDCRYCHDSVGESSFAGVPSTDTCMTCHSQIWTNAQMLEPVRQSLVTGDPIEWVRVHDLPDFVYFNHAAHVNSGVGCESCHGRVDQMPLMRQDKPLTMQWCLDCHRDPAGALRPPGAVTEMGYEPGEDDWTGTALLQHYGIERDHLLECTICHR
ncbi:MAG: cytochrome c3 family protein [Halofilum sp. (in: g-proteobacteria)]